MADSFPLGYSRSGQLMPMLNFAMVSHQQTKTTKLAGRIRLGMNNPPTPRAVDGDDVLLKRKASAQGRNQHS